MAAKYDRLVVQDITRTDGRKKAEIDVEFFDPLEKKADVQGVVSHDGDLTLTIDGVTYHKEQLPGKVKSHKTKWKKKTVFIKVKKKTAEPWIFRDTQPPGPSAKTDDAAGGRTASGAIAVDSAGATAPSASSHSS